MKGDLRGHKFEQFVVASLSATDANIFEGFRYSKTFKTFSCMVQ